MIVLCVGQRQDGTPAVCVRCDRGGVCWVDREWARKLGGIRCSCGARGTYKPQLPISAYPYEVAEADVLTALQEAAA